LAYDTSKLKAACLFHVYNYKAVFLNIVLKNTLKS